MRRRGGSGGTSSPRTKCCWWGFVFGRGIFKLNFSFSASSSSFYRHGHRSDDADHPFPHDDEGAGFLLDHRPSYDEEDPGTAAVGAPAAPANSRVVILAVPVIYECTLQVKMNDLLLECRTPPAWLPGREDKSFPRPLQNTLKEPGRCSSPSLLFLPGPAEFT